MGRLMTMSIRICPQVSGGNSDNSTTTDTDNLSDGSTDDSVATDSDSGSDSSGDTITTTLIPQGTFTISGDLVSGDFSRTQTDSGSETAFDTDKVRFLSQI